MAIRRPRNRIFVHIGYSFYAQAGLHATDRMTHLNGVYLDSVEIMATVLNAALENVKRGEQVDLILLVDRDAFQAVTLNITIERQTE